MELFERGTSAFCLGVDAAVSIAKAQAPATSYCSSYLHISTSTKTTTVKPSPYGLPMVIQRKREPRLLT